MISTLRTSEPDAQLWRHDGEGRLYNKATDLVMDVTKGKPFVLSNYIFLLFRCARASCCCDDNEQAVIDCLGRRIEYTKLGAPGCPIFQVGVQEAESGKIRATNLSQQQSRRQNNGNAWNLTHSNHTARQHQGGLRISAAAAISCQGRRPKVCCFIGRTHLSCWKIVSCAGHQGVVLFSKRGLACASPVC